MDTEIIADRIEVAEDHILALDERIDAIEEQTTEEPPAPDPAPVTDAVPAAPVIDLAQTVGRLEAELTECRQIIQECQSEIARLSSLATVVEPEPEEAPPVMEVEPEPEKESESGGALEREPNWLEKLLLAR